MTPDTMVHVGDASGVAEARRAAAGVASACGFEDGQAGKLALAVTELCTNLVKHAGGGTVLLQSQRNASGNASGVRLLALDNGPGMANVARCLEDGYSTAGSAGIGLGVVKRAAAMFDAYSMVGKGTAVLCDFDAAAPSPMTPLAMVFRPKFESGGVNVAMKGETECGDTFRVIESEGVCAILVADGLGHGPRAAEASKLAADSFRWKRGDDLLMHISTIDSALHVTRGAAIAIAEVDASRNVVRYSGVGNISGEIISPDGAVRRMVSQNGTAGAGKVRPMQFTYPWEAGSLLVMYSDGMQSRWDLAAYPALGRRHPALVAGVLYRDFNRGRDDITSVVVREAAS